MARKQEPKDSALVLISGDDDFEIKKRAKEIYQKWVEDSGTLDQETVSGFASNSQEAAAAAGRLLEALQTLSFFGGLKVVWFKDCNFLGDDRTGGSKAVLESLANLAEVLKQMDWTSVRLVISAGKVDKRRAFFKAVQKLGSVESFAALSMEDRNWMARAESIVREYLQERGKSIAGDAAAEMASMVGPHSRQLISESEKLALYVGDRDRIQIDDVRAVVVRNKQARAFALADALGDRDASRLIRALDEELWEMKTDRQKSVIGLLYGVISKIRVMLFLKEILRRKWLSDAGDYQGFKAQLQAVPQDAFPEDRRFNPLSMNPYILFRALPQSRRYTMKELASAMDQLLECNRRMISGSSDDGSTLRQTLIRIALPGRSSKSSPH